jgi:hypothetical protein
MDVRFRAPSWNASSLVLRKRTQPKQKRSKKKLTIGMKIDNLEKFAKTSLVAEVIPDRPGQE